MKEPDSWLRMREGTGWMDNSVLPLAPMSMIRVGRGILGAAGLFFDGTVGTGDLVDVPDSPLLEPANVTLEV